MHIWSVEFCEQFVFWYGLIFEVCIMYIKTFSLNFGLMNTCKQHLKVTEKGTCDPLFGPTKHSGIDHNKGKTIYMVIIL